MRDTGSYLMYGFLRFLDLRRQLLQCRNENQVERITKWKLLLEENLALWKGKPMEGIVEQMRDESTIRVYLLPEFQFVQVFVAGVQSAILLISMGQFQMSRMET
ncbi:unnamed protein product [Arabidopsis thaliana]|uniref:(thale cress) hypothetical protein n=1 Tax=Arabidopsis thaliana TaxID=3702 RepID=A0A7G2DNC7_ARATH|nr:unnamed protein product [Arabidopsis thaliana]